MSAMCIHEREGDIFSELVELQLFNLEQESVLFNNSQLILHHGGG